MVTDISAAAPRPLGPAPVPTTGDAQKISPEQMSTLMRGVARAIMQSLGESSRGPAANDVSGSDNSDSDNSGDDNGGGG